jgi:hypothetical protein
MEYLFPLLSFVGGGGISTLIHVRYAKKNNKLDYADKAMKFMEDVQDKMNGRINELEGRIKTLEETACISMECNDRNNPYKKTK